MAPTTDEHPWANYASSSYGELNADSYDTFFAAVSPAGWEDEIDFLTELGRGKVLELGVGTGRVALPLAQRGLDVVGIDASPSMLRHLAEKDPSNLVSRVLGDFAEAPVDGSFGLIYCVAQSFLQLGTQDAQTRCFERVGELLDKDGVFVLQAWVPNPGRFFRNQIVAIWHLDMDSVHLEVSRYDPITQVVRTQHVALSHEGVTLRPVVQRDVWLSELDLMAKIANLRLTERWADWRRSPFSANSPSHISVYRRA